MIEEVMELSTIVEFLIFNIRRLSFYEKKEKEVPQHYIEKTRENIKEAQKLLDILQYYVSEEFYE